MQLTILIDRIKCNNYWVRTSVFNVNTEITKIVIITYFQRVHQLNYRLNRWMSNYTKITIIKIYVVIFVTRQKWKKSCTIVRKTDYIYDRLSISEFFCKWKCHGISLQKATITWSQVYPVYLKLRHYYADHNVDI